MNEEQLIVGFVRGSHGVSGEFKVESASGYYNHIELLKEVTLRNGSTLKTCRVESTRLGGNSLFMKLAEINSPEEVKKFRNWELVVPREYAHPLGENEWYIEDLKGCSLVWNGGTAAKTAPAQVVGTITDVLEGGAGYLLEVLLSESCDVLSEDVKFTVSGKIRKVLIHFNFHYISEVDVTARTIQLMHLWILE